jgi:hypothetical protein
VAAGRPISFHQYSEYEGHDAALQDILINANSSGGKTKGYVSVMWPSRTWFVVVRWTVEMSKR